MSSTPQYNPFNSRDYNLPHTWLHAFVFFFLVQYINFIFDLLHNHQPQLLCIHHQLLLLYKNEIYMWGITFVFHDQKGTIIILKKKSRQTVAFASNQICSVLLYKNGDFCPNFFWESMGSWLYEDMIMCLGHV